MKQVLLIKKNCNKHVGHGELTESKILWRLK